MGALNALKLAGIGLGALTTLGCYFLAVRPALKVGLRGVISCLEFVFCHLIHSSVIISLRKL